MVVVTGSTANRADMFPVVQCSINDTSEKPLCSRRWVWQNCSCHSCSLSQESDLDIMFPPAMKGFRRHLLPIPTRGNVCCVLKRSSDGRVRSSLHCPNKKATVNALLPQFPDFASVVREIAIKCRLCGVSAGCRYFLSSPASVIHTCIPAFPPSTSSCSQLLRKCSSCIAKVFPQLISILFGQNSSVFQHFLSGNIPQPFLRHETSRLELIPQSTVFLACNSSFSSFNFPFSRFLTRNLASSRT